MKWKVLEEIFKEKEVELSVEQFIELLCDFKMEHQRIFLGHVEDLVKTIEDKEKTIKKLEQLEIEKNKIDINFPSQSSYDYLKDKNLVEQLKQNDIKMKELKDRYFSPDVNLAKNNLKLIDMKTDNLKEMIMLLANEVIEGRELFFDGLCK